MLTKTRLAAVLVACSIAGVLEAQEVEIAAVLSFTEGPTVDRAGTVYFTDIQSQRIMKLGADGVLSTYREHSNGANGLLIDPEGRLIACEGAQFERGGVKFTGTTRVTRTDLRTGTIETLADGYQVAPLVGPNDVTIDGKGRLYFLNGCSMAQANRELKRCKTLRGLRGHR